MNYIKILKKYNHLIFVLGEQALRSGSNLIIGILLARSASKEEYGMYTFLFPILIIILGVQNGLTSTPYVTLLPGIKDNHKRFLGNVLHIHIFISTALISASGIFIFIQKHFSLNYIPNSILLFYTMAVISWLLRDFLRQVLLAELRVKSVFHFGLVVNGLSIIISWLLYFNKLLHIKSVYLTLTLSSLLPAIIFLLYKRKLFRGDYSRLKEDFRRCYKMGKWLAGRSLLGLVSGPTILTAYLVSLGNYSDVALYGVYMLPANILSPVSQALISYSVPKMTIVYQNGILALKKIVNKMTVLLLFLIIVFNLVVVLTADNLIHILFSGKYEPVIFLVFLFTFQMSILIFAIPVNSALVAIKDTRSGFISEFLATAIMVSTGFIFIKYWGLTGLGFSLLLSRLLGRFYQIFVFNRLTVQSETEVNKDA